MHRPGSKNSSCNGMRTYHNTQPISAFRTMAMNRSSQTRKYEEVSVKLRELYVPQMEPLGQSNLQFHKLQQSDQHLIQEDKIKFGEFVAREAIHDDEYWTAAWLRAETHCEDQRNARYFGNFVRQFAEREFNSLKRRCKAQVGQKCTCIVTVRKEKRNVKNTISPSIVGTLDLSIQHLLPGETFPGEQMKAPLLSRINGKVTKKYGYIANLCVAQSARRQGIAGNMLHFAIKSAKSNGADQVFVHLHQDNIPAQQLYWKMGFEMVKMASHQLSREQTYLLCFMG